MIVPRQTGGLQFEIIANLLIVVISGLTVVAAVMGVLASRSVEESALRELRMGARHLERALATESPRLVDLAALVRSVRPQTLGGRWAVLNERGRELGRSVNLELTGARLKELALRSARSEAVLRGSGILVADLALVVHVRSPTGETGTLVGAISKLELTARLLPSLQSGAWVLFAAASVFVLFGSYLLGRRIVRPLKTLSAATRQLAGGDLDLVTPVSGSDELAELSRSFNHMAASLREERDALARAYRSLTQSERLAAVGQLAAGVAHEVGNPLAAILGYAEVILRDDQASGRTRDAAEKIRDESLRISALAREMLDLGRPVSILSAPLEPLEVLERIRQRMSSQKLLAGVAIEVRGDAGLASVTADPRRLDQILVNLIENAAHAVRSTPSPAIELNASRIRGTRIGRRREDSANRARSMAAIVLQVIDNGPGIELEHQAQLFDPFFTTKEPGEGTGLGLWNCHRLAELIGGVLEVESEPGRTCFSLILPVADTAADNVEPAHSDHR